MINIMGNRSSRVEIRVIKKGKLYDDIKHQMKPLDALLFRGSDVVSNIISILEKRGKRNSPAGDFTHAGIVINRDILDLPQMDPDKLYILESVMSGTLGCGIKDIYGKTHLSVQIRDLESLINAYDHPDHTAIAWCPLINNPYANHDPVIKHAFTHIYNDIKGIPWDANCYSLLSSLWECLRPCRPCIETMCHTSRWLFCSEMVATVYKELRIYPDYVNPKDVVPGDIVYPYEDTDEMPTIIDQIVYITSPKHYSPDVSPIDAIIHCGKNNLEEVNPTNGIIEVADKPDEKENVKKDVKSVHYKSGDSNDSNDSDDTSASVIVKMTVIEDKEPGNKYVNEDIKDDDVAEEDVKKKLLKILK
jgi:hypothetical protein